ncbi:AcrR family transcriptional regulator [Roseibium marinum]|uniref:AcrR family transcriptional regulator n=1 Tax=Roseibium marinum TaxID=281252 RepID=A0A2S3UM56_9HYPH|nr:AcrR family transcriptional regulator [Roseibium marinum]
MRVTSALLDAALRELAQNGYEQTTLAAIAARAGTSKQAVYRRYEGKAGLIAAAVGQGLQVAGPAAPLRGSVAGDLRQCLSDMVAALQETPLGGAVRALVPYRHVPEFAPVLEEAETARRLVLRQIFIATPFEADMETRIDLLLGLVHFRLLFGTAKITQNDIDTAIYLVLGLVAPRDPVPRDGLPGI